jgi:hypothetical protein
MVHGETVSPAGKRRSNPCSGRSAELIDYLRADYFLSAESGFTVRIVGWPGR